MEPDRLQLLLAQARRLHGAARDRFLADLAASDPVLARQLQELLDALHVAADTASVESGPSAIDRLEKHLKDLPADTLEQIGRYRILERLGEGGMGTVYRAEQREPIRRIVALKVIKRGFDSREIVARFEAERQVLARMDHPHIAKVFDAGTTDSGQPYFVMEFVPGEPITSFADTHKLPIAQRLELFAQVCDAIQHAHTKAVIHRDITARNVMAYMSDGKPMVKVIDFGVAKALSSDRLSEITYHTGHGVALGTYEYMSPEQAAGSPDIDTRTDVYSLGVLLYELLVGARPFDKDTFARAADIEIRQIIREREPPRPSTRLTSMGETATRLADSRRIELDALKRQLRRELEWIPLKALRKQRDRRYQTVAQLSQDIANYRAGRPLVAGPESRWYRMRKFVARNRAAVGSAVLGAALAAAGVAFYVHSIRAEQQKTRREFERAEHERDAAFRESQNRIVVTNFLQDMISGADPEIGWGPTITVGEMLLKAESRVDRFATNPETEAAIREALFFAFRGAGNVTKSLEHATASLALRRAALGEDHLATVAAKLHYAMILQELGRLSEAQTLTREVVEWRRRVLGEEHDETLVAQNNLATVLQELSRLGEAEQLARRVYEARLKINGPAHFETIKTASNLGVILTLQNRFAEAEKLFAEQLPLARTHLGESHPTTLTIASNLAYALTQLGDTVAAEELIRKVVDQRTRIFGAQHPDTFSSIDRLATILSARREFDQAVKLEKALLEDAQKSLGPLHPMTLRLANNLGHILQNQLKQADAEPYLRQAAEGFLKLQGIDNINTQVAMNGLATVLRQQRRDLEEAEKIYRQVLEARTRVLGATDADTLATKEGLARLLGDQKRWEEAEPLARELYEISKSRLPQRDADAAGKAIRYGLCLAALNRFDDAIEPLAAGLDAINLPPGSNDARKIPEALAECFDKSGQPIKARELRARWGLDAPSTVPATQPQ